MGNCSVLVNKLKFHSNFENQNQQFRQERANYRGNDKLFAGENL